MTSRDAGRRGVSLNHVAISLARPLIHGWRQEERLRFLIVGAFNTVTGYAVFVVAWLLLGDTLHYLGVVVVGHVAATTIAFLSHRRLVFRSTGRPLGQFLRFNAHTLCILAGGLLLLPAIVEGLHLHPIVGQGVVVATTALLGYPLHKHGAFGERNE